MGLGVNGAVVGDLVDLLTLPTNFSDGVFLGFLKLFDDAIHYINKDNLGSRSALVDTNLYLRYLISGHVQLLSNEATSNVSSAKMDGLFLGLFLRCAHLCGRGSSLSTVFRWSSPV